MRCRTILTLCLVAVAGCVGAPAPADDPPTEATPIDATATPATATATPYPNETVVFPPGPKSRPALPETLTAETAGTYAKRHEYRYSYNDLWSGPDTEVGMSEHSCSVESTEPAGAGYLVTVRCTAYVNEPSAGESTRTQHLDYPPWTVRYYVDENSVVREELE